MHYSFVLHTKNPFSQQDELYGEVAVGEKEPQVRRRPPLSIASDGNSEERRAASVLRLQRFAFRRLAPFCVGAAAQVSEKASSMDGLEARCSLRVDEARSRK